MTYRPVDATSGWTQVWNGENRMVETSKGSDRLTFKYDYMGRRVEKCMYSNNTLTSKTLFVYDGFKCVEELDALASNAVAMRHAWQPFDVGLDVILATTDGSGTSYFLHDVNKNVMQRTVANGALQETYAYAPFGGNAGTDRAHIGFSSEVAENDMEMVYYNYRYLLTQLGRWIKRDLIEELDGNNLYQHLKNDVASFDYLGLFTDMNDLYPGMFSPGTPSRYIPNLPVPNMPGTPSPESAKKICCNDGVKVVIDDAGRQCCQNEIKIIEVRTDASIPLFHSGHTYIYIPAHGAISETGYGFHPGCEWGILGQKGEVKIYGPKKPFTQNLTYKYHACPNSIIELENKINATKANLPGWILFGTWPGSAKIILDKFLPAYNCSSMACKWLKDACFTPPYNPRTIVFPMPFGIGRGGYINE